jgi:hypothetical protein
MTELERALLALGDRIDFPLEPDLRERVHDRLERKRRKRFPRPLAFAFAMVVIAFGIAMAVPPARSAILRFFHIGAVRIERVQTLPPARERPLAAGLGPALTLDQAESRSGIRLILHAPRPDRFYAQPGLIATLLQYRGQPVLLAELEGDQTGITKKMATPGTSVQPAQIGLFGLWLSGGKHVLYWQATPGTSTRRIEPRLAGNVLLWTQGDRTFRLEGALPEVQMLELARDITR